MIGVIGWGLCRLLSHLAAQLHRAGYRRCRHGDHETRNNDGAEESHKFGSVRLVAAICNSPVRDVPQAADDARQL